MTEELDADRPSMNGAMDSDALTKRELSELAAENALRQRWMAERDSPRRWSILRAMYSRKLPRLLQRRCSPYFLDWDFTPIEQLAWQDIRGLGLPFYPQFPALEYFIDFADPLSQIGVELDGRAYHDTERDRRRDARLWGMGWRIFRLQGREALATPGGRDSVFERIRDMQEQGEPDPEYRLLRFWGERWSEGFFWALSVTYYGRPASEDALSAASVILDKHKGIDFPLELDWREW